jgi:hypothetical protein
MIGHLLIGMSNMVALIATEIAPETNALKLNHTMFKYISYFNKNVKTNAYCRAINGADL